MSQTSSSDTNADNTQQYQQSTSTIHALPTDLDILKHFGTPESLARDAVHTFAVQKVKERISTCREEVERIQQKYGLTFEAFQERVTSDEKFVEALKLVHPLWEIELNRWQFYQLELQEENLEFTGTRD